MSAVGREGWMDVAPPVRSQCSVRISYIRTTLMRDFMSMFSWTARCWRPVSVPSCVCISSNSLCPMLLWTTRLCDNGSSNPWPLVAAGVCCPDTAGLRGPVPSRPGSSGAARRTASHLEPGQHFPCHPTAVGGHGSRSLLPNSLPPCPTCGHPARRHVPDSRPGRPDSGR